MKKQILTGAALLALVAGQVQAQTPPDQGAQPQRGGGWQGRGGGGPRPEGGQRPDFNRGGGERPQFNGGDRPRFDGGQRADFNRGGAGGWQNRGGGAPQAAAPAAPSAPALTAQPNFGGDRGGGFRGQRFGGGPSPQAAPAGTTPLLPNPVGPGVQDSSRFNNGQGYGRRFGGGGDRFSGEGGPGSNDRRFSGQRFGGGANDGRFNDQRSVGGDPRANGWRPDGGGRRFNGQRFAGDGQRYGDRGGYRGGARSFSYRGRSYGAFQAQPYRYPRGYGYRRYAVRSYLPLALIGSSWFLNDWSSYYLSPPPAAQYRWVRYGPDALLVDTYTGQVVDAAYGVFDDGQGQGYEDYGQYPDDAYGGNYPPPSYPGPY